MRQMAGFDLRALLSEQWGMLSLRDVARLVAPDLWRVMASFVIVLLEGRCSVRQMTAGFVNGYWCPFFVAAW